MAVDGKWSITVNSPMGAQKSDIDIKASGGALTGKQSSPQGSMDIANGKADGDNVSWSVDVTSPFPMKLEFSGTVSGDAISGSVKAGSFGSFPFSGNRA